MTKQGFTKLKSLNEALEIIDRLIKETEDEEISLNDSLGSVLSHNITSSMDVPDFEKSAMDGFALIASDTFGATQTHPKVFEIIDSITAGVISKKEIKNGECIEITTGAPLPEGADSVVMVENTEKEGNKVKIYKALAPGENIIRIGSDVKKGSLVLHKGTKLTPQKIGVLSALGFVKIIVKKKPVVAYFSSGNEIQKNGHELIYGKVYDINSATITSAIKQQCCEVIDLGLAKDDIDEIISLIKKGVESSDFVVLSGGSSLGAEDFMVEAVKSLGEVLVHGIAVKPGKPVLIGKVDAKLVLGLPGYPTSCLSNFYILVLHILNKMRGVNQREVSFKKKLSRKIASTIGRFEFLPVRIEGDYAVPVLKGSSSISTLSESDGYIEISENDEVLNKDDEVEVKFFDSFIN